MVTVSQSYTTSSSYGETVAINCASGQMGQVFWVPLHTRYIGAYEPSGDEVTVWIPENTRESAGNFQVTCTG